MAEETEDWIFDSVVGFLCSPLWKTPILNFIEQNCLGRQNGGVLNKNFSIVRRISVRHGGGEQVFLHRNTSELCQTSMTGTLLRSKSQYYC